MTEGPEVRLRPAAPDDERRLWEWANDPVVRSWAFSSEAIPYEDHVRWFKARLTDPGCRLFIVVDRDGQPVGQIRTDRRQAGELEISFSIADPHRGRGFGTAALRALEQEYLAQGESVRLVGRVKPQNTASTSAFARAGYARLPNRKGGGEDALVFGRDLKADGRAEPASARTVVIVQARTGSTRLPGKVLADIGGEPMLARVVNRVRRARRVSAVAVATSTLAADDPIEALATALGVPCVRGSEADVLDRFAVAARATNADVIVRVTADCPLVDAGVIDDVVGALLDGDAPAEYCSNVIERRFPRGLDVEAFTRDALECAAADAVTSRHREHVTLFLVEHPERFRLRSVVWPEDHSGNRWTVDEEADLAFVRAVYQRVSPDAGWREILQTLESEPALTSINADVRQKSTKV